MKIQNVGKSLQLFWIVTDTAVIYKLFQNKKEIFSYLKGYVRWLRKKDGSISMFTMWDRFSAFNP